MKQRIQFVVVVSVVALSILACQVGDLVPVGGPGIRGSGNVVTQEEAITGFDKVDISYSFEVDISQGDTFSVVVRADDNIVKYLQVVKLGNTLQIGLEPNHPDIRSATLQAEVTMPELAGLDLSGASHVTITGLTSAKRVLVVDASGASHLRGDIEAGNASFDLAGSSGVTLSGSAQDVTIDAAGGSEADLSAFSVVDANVEARGKSQVTVNVSGRLDVDASNGANVYYLGNPTLGTITESGKAEVRPR
jgi:hypothetical protein